MKITGIVIKSLDYKESSKIVYLYTPQGNTSVIAKGAKRIKKGVMSFTTIGNYVSYETTKSSIPTLIDYHVVDNFNNIKNNLIDSLYYYHILELIYKLPTDIDHKRVFSFILKMLEYTKENINVILIATIIQVKLTYSFGVNPNFNDNGGRFFSLEEANFTNDLSDKTILNKKDFSIFKLLYTFDINKDFSIFEGIDYLKYFKIINSYYNYHVHLNLKGLNTLYSLNT